MLIVQTKLPELLEDELVHAAVANQSTWSAAITGPIAIVGTDPVFHYLTGVTAGATLTKNAIALATSVSGSPGAYICLSCYYETITGTTDRGRAPVLRHLHRRGWPRVEFGQHSGWD